MIYIPRTNKISELTRRDIIDFINLESVNWAGRLEETEFLSRIYNLKQMRSEDSRFQDALGDIWQHRINNYDWDDDWVFYDTRFNLLSGDDDALLRFLSEMLHPAVRPNMDEVWSLYENINVYLKRDGFQLVEVRRMSGKPIFEGRPFENIDNPAIQAAKGCLTVIDESYLIQQIQRMESGIENDPDLAIGTAKEFIETICKTIIMKRTGDCPENAKMNQLVRQVAELLSLTPKGIPDEAKAADTIKKILGSLSAITHGMAELRNTYGTGHGKKAGTKGLSPRHAKLVVGMASALAIFLWDTHQEK
jgi:hypothetical protein